MAWIVARQTPYNEVKYVTDSDKVSLISYYDFLKFLLSYPILNKNELTLELDKFQTIFINLDSGEWKVKKQIINKEKYSFEEMCKINNENEEKEKTKYEERLDKGHLFLKNYKKDFLA